MVEENAGDSPKEVTKTPVDEFMLAEYQTIASAHFDLHNGLRQNFRFYLGLVAVPVTVLAAFKDVNINVFDLPTVLMLLFAVTPFLGLLMFLSMINTRFDIILYTRTVNAVRAYFKMRAEQLELKDFHKYLKLPTDKFKPPYFEGFIRAYTWLFTAISFTNSRFIIASVGWRSVPRWTFSSSHCLQRKPWIRTRSNFVSECHRRKPARRISSLREANDCIARVI